MAAEPVPHLASESRFLFFLAMLFKLKVHAWWQYKLKFAIIHKNVNQPEVVFILST